MNTPIGEAAWAYVTVRRLFQPLREALGMDDNPLAVGIHCDTCGTRLDKPERPCPICPTTSPRLAILNESALMYARTAGA